MITLITGLPGNGKTLYALAYVKAWAEKEGREVYYSGINDLKLPWVEIEPEKWFEAPAKSIIVIDECQRVFRPRSFGSHVPEFVSKLETHRHQGLDIVLITQHPMLTDPSIRRLAGRHLHVVRKWGTESATVHEWPAVRDNCDKPAGRKDSEKQAWKYPKSAYEFYKSAEAHTVKRNIPKRVIILLTLPFIFAACVWYMYQWTQKKIHPDVAGQVASGQVTGVSSQPVGQGGQVVKASYRNAIDDARQFAFERTARVAGLQYTAPRYDEITKPTTAPVPAACIEMKTRCLCYSQQGTPLAVESDTCRQIVAHGYFLDFDPNGENGRRGEQRDAGQLVSAEAVPLRVAASGEPQRSVPANVAVLGDGAGYGVLGGHTGPKR